MSVAASTELLPVSAFAVSPSCTRPGASEKTVSHQISVQARGALAIMKHVYLCISNLSPYVRTSECIWTSCFDKGTLAPALHQIASLKSCLRKPQADPVSVRYSVPSNLIHFSHTKDTSKSCWSYAIYAAVHLSSAPASEHVQFLGLPTQASGSWHVLGCPMRRKHCERPCSWG